MENKYFVPDIEDLHIGYEFEIINNFGLFEVDEDTIPWTRHILKEGDIHAAYDDYTFLEICVQYLNSNRLRVPYLTKEQVEAEGWVFHSQGNSGGIFYLLFKNSFRVTIWIDSLEIEFEESEGNTLFYGECKDINTFRKICKLLNIK
jgi:hypothetical protein